MNLPTTCGQDGCDQPAAFRFTWPGRLESGVCVLHVTKLRAVAGALGFRLEVIPLPNAGDLLEEKLTELRRNLTEARSRELEVLERELSRLPGGES